MMDPYKPPMTSPSPSPSLQTGVVSARTKTQSFVARFISIIVVTSAVLGLLYNLASIPSFLMLGDLSSTTSPFFKPAYWLMTAICVAFYAGLIVNSLRLWRGVPGAAGGISRLFAAEVAYFFCVSMLWLVPVVGSGVAAATGIANGGLTAQFVILLPVWVPLAFLTFGLYEKETQGTRV